MSRPLPPNPPPPPPGGMPWPEPDNSGVPAAPLAPPVPPPPPKLASLPSAGGAAPPPNVPAPNAPPLNSPPSSGAAGIPATLGGTTRVGVRSPAAPAVALPKSAGSEPQLRSRLQQLKRRRAKGWEKLRRLPGYALIESIWLRLSQMRGAGEPISEEQRKRELPAWLVSFLVHVSILLALALIPIAQMAADKLQILDGSFVEGGQGAIEFAPVPEGSDISLEEINLPLTNNVVNAPTLEFDPAAISATLSKSSSDGPASSLEGLDVSNGLAGRTGSLKGALLGKYGGTDQTQAAVAAGLEWLAKRQKSDGGWSLTGPYNNGAYQEDRTGATAMALNAFLGGGHTHLAEGKYQYVVSRGLKFLLNRQDKEGFFAAESPDHNQAYAQAIATITVCEAYGMTGDSQLKVPATRALKYAEWAQGRQKGWRYEPREDSDLSVTGWYLMALMTGKMAGLEVNEKVILSVSDYLETVSHEYGSRYAYQRNDPLPSLTMTAEGLLCRQYLGWPASHPALQRAIKVDLLPAAPSVNDELMNVYFWYYATQVLHHVGGQPWVEWNDKMKVTLPKLQVKKGAETGSWDPFNDQFASQGGRLYITCFCIYCLEVYYRHMALYDLKPGNVVRPQSSNEAEAEMPETTSEP